MIPSSKEAFLPVAGECSIPLDFSQHDFKFTRHWFRNRNQSSWSTFLKPKFNGEFPIRFLQVGVFESYDLCWIFQNILTHPDSRAVGIDPWVETTKLEQSTMSAVEARARHNLAPWADKVKIIKGYSQDVMPILDGYFDCVVIDGDHRKEAVIEDAKNAVQLTKPGAWILFDDVRNRVFKKDHVQQALDVILSSGLKMRLKLVWRHRYVDCFERI